MAENAFKYCWIFFFFVGFSTSQAQEVSSERKYQNARLSDILIDIAGEHKLNLVLRGTYSQQQRITVDLSNKSLHQSLKRVLDPFHIQFKIEGNSLILKRYIRVYGTIRDERSGEVLINATIRDPNSGRGTIANEYGFYSLRVPEKSAQLEVKYLGYTTGYIPVHAAHEQHSDITLASSIELQEVIVLRSSSVDLAEREGMSTSILNQDLNTVFATGGTPDIFQYLYKQSGITSGPDGLGGLHVRGGGVGHNLILYDGVELYNPSHSFGLFSVFNPAAINRSTLYKSGFPSQYGAKLSSIVDIRMKEGSIKKWSSELTLSTLASSLRFDGPIVNGKTGLMIALRRSHVDPFIKRYSQQQKEEDFNEGQSNHFFYDANVKLHHVFGIRDRLFLTYFRSHDSYDDETLIFIETDEEYFDDRFSFNLDWSNELSALRWNHIYGSKLFSNTQLSSSRFQFGSYSLADQYSESLANQDVRRNNFAAAFVSEIRNISLNHDLDYFINEAHRLKFGAGYNWRHYNPGVITSDIDEINDTEEFFEETYFDRYTDSTNSYQSNEFHLYMDHSWAISPIIQLSGGVRTTWFRGRDNFEDIDFSHLVASGSLRLDWHMNSKWLMSFSYDRTQQPLHLLTSSDIGFPNDLWVPSTDLIKPQVGHQYDATLRHQTSVGLEGSVSLYFKQQHNLIRFGDEVQLPTVVENISNFWEEDVLVGEGQAYGLNLDLSLSRSLFQLDVSYSYMSAKRKFPELNGGNYFPFQFDLKHSFSMNGALKLSKGLSAYANFKFATGMAQTLVTTDLPFSPLDIYFIPEDVTASEINDYRLQDYHRLDLGIQYKLGAASTQHELALGVQNVYNRKNIYYSYNIDNSLLGESDGIRSKAGLPILPTISYSLRFN